MIHNSFGKYIIMIRLYDEVMVIYILEFSFKVTLSSPCLWTSFHPPIPSLSEVCQLRKFYSIWVGYEI